VRLRSASVLDVARIEQIHREAEDRVGTEPAPARLWSLVSQTLTALLPLAQDSLMYVAEVEGRVAGFIQASGRGVPLSLPSRPAALQVLNLCVARQANHQTIAPALLAHLVRQAGSRGIHQLFVRIPLDDPLLSVFRQQSFRQFATESVLFADGPSPATEAVPAGVRAYRGRDEPHVYNLYRRVTPPAVAQLEAPSYRSWRANRTPAGQQEVVEQVELVAWWSLQRGSQTRPHILSFLVQPEPALAAQLASRALQACSGQPAWSSLRHYDAPMIDALRRCGFSVLLRQGLLVRDSSVPELAAEQALVPSFG
jgi:GNAT superfamily N-acetyltransferase